MDTYMYITGAVQVVVGVCLIGYGIATNSVVWLVGGAAIIGNGVVAVKVADSL